MLSKKIALSLITALSLHASTQNVELLANEVKKVGNKIEAIGDVVVYSEEYLMTSQRAVYDEDSGEIELFENVNIIKGQEESTQSEYAKVNMNSEDGEYSPFFYYDQRSDIWLQCEDASSSTGYFITQKSVVSSCNIQDPDWKIEFSEGKLNRESSYLHLWNPVFYLKGVPIFYTPYFGFSTDNTRRTGFLIPYISYVSSEGLHYEQPFFYAPEENWDLELIPQVRTSRGVGIYGTIRFVDSQYSEGSLTAGYFREKSSFIHNENTNNLNSIKNEHKGFNFTYTRTKLISDYLGSNVQDALWMDITRVSDVEYINIANNSDDEYTDKDVISRVNYFLTDDTHYFGIYGKYFQDIKNENNDRAEAPMFQYHKYTDTIFFDNLTYSLDLATKNYISKSGLDATQYEITVPLKFSTSLFDEYLQFSVSENFYATYVDYEDKKSREWNEHFYKNYHKITLYTDLAKAYSNFFHAVNFGLEYIVPSFNKGAITEDFISTNIEVESISAKLVQFFYTAEGRKFLRHSMSQPYVLDKKYYKYGDFENKIDLYVTPELSISNEFRYSHEFSKFTKVQTSLNYSSKDYKFSTIHTYSDTDINKPKDQYITMSAEAKVVSAYSVFGHLNYDIKDNYTTSWQIGGKFRKKCWDYSLSYRQKTELTQSGSRVKDAVILMFNFYPIGGIDYEYEISRKNTIENQ